MELRALTPSDQAAAAFLEAEAFGGGKRPAPPLDKPGSPALGVFEGSRLVALATIHSLHLNWDGREAPMGGIAGVACAADQRGRGHVGHLMAESLRAMQEAGQYLSGLYPFALVFYRRHGWEWVGEKRQYTIPAAELPFAPEGRHLRCYDGPEALEVIRPMYDAFTRRYRGMTTRRDPIPNFWGKAVDHIDNRTTYVQVYENPQTGQAEGYLTFRFPEDDDPGQVGEFFANTPEAYKGLLSVLHYYGTQIEKVEFSAPANDPLPFHFMHWDLKTRVRPLFMGRVVDVAAAFAALRPDPAFSGKIILQVADAQCEWNRQTFSVTLEAGHVTAAVSQSAPGVTLDIQALTQAYWGQPALDLVRVAGRLLVSDETQYALLSRLLPPKICYLQDFF